LIEVLELEEIIENNRSYAIAAWIFMPIVTIAFEWFWWGYISPLLTYNLSYILQYLFLFLLLILTVNIAFKRLVPRYRRGKMLLVGFLWMILFLVFDVILQYYIFMINPDVTLLDYNIFAGRLRWLLLLVMLFGPFFMVRTHIGDPDLFSMPIGKMATIGLLPSSLKIAYYRRRGAEIGEGVSIGPLSILDCKKIVIGDHVDIGMACMIRANEFQMGRYSKLGMLVIIDTHKVVIGEEVTIQEQVYIGGLKTDKSTIEIGDLSMIFAQSVINPTHPIKIGKRVGIGGSNFLFTHGTWQPILDGFPVAFGPITIEDGVWFPWRVFVLPNVHIGKEATIGAGSVINRDVPARSLAAGVPAKVLRKDGEYIKKYTDEEKRDILKDMLVELVGYLRIEDWSVTDPILEKAYAKTTFRTPYGPSSKVDNHVIFMFEDKDEYWNMIKERTFVITLFPIDTERTSSLEEQGCWWFDLANSTWGGPRTKVSLVINGWLSRYGHWMKYSS
jgi:acetyltransferase-like isoleucine patch superfamily enzyme